MRKAVVTLFIILAFWFMIPLPWGILHIGMIYPAVLFFVAAWAVAKPDKIKKAFSGRFRRVVRALLVLIIIGVLAVAVPIGFMVGAACKAPAEDATVIVLGCQVRGSEPSRMLTDRCNAALEYLNAHPDAKCVASGGKGSGEDISEAQAIFNYLVSHGIGEDRIFIEDRSTSTAENLAFSAEVIRKNTGVRYARTTVASGDFARQEDLCEFKPSVHHYPNWEKVFAMGEQFLSLPAEADALFYVWGHGYELDIAKDWDRFEEFLQMMANKKDIHYLTNKDALLRKE